MNSFIFILLIISLAQLGYGEKVMLEDGSIYDEQEAWTVLWYSKVSYCPVEEINSWTCVPCSHFNTLVDVKAFMHEKHQVQGYTAYDTAKKTIVVAFRGTSNWANIIQDADFLMVNYPECADCKVHHGFYKMYLDVSDIVRNQTLELINKYPTSPLTLTGHSMGAAISTIAAIDIHKNIKEVEIFYSYGCPRVGNQKFAAYFSTLLPNPIRVTHWRDIFAHNPPREIGYKHYATEVFYNEPSTEYKICDSTGEDPTCINSVWQLKYADHISYLGISTSCDNGIHNLSDPFLQHPRDSDDAE